MSQVWLIRPVMPVPEPPPRTAMAAPGFLPMYSSARIWTRLTMVSEPLTWIILAAARSEAAPRSARVDRAMTVIFFMSCFSFRSVLDPNAPQKDRKNVRLKTMSLFFVALAL